MSNLSDAQITGKLLGLSISYLMLKDTMSRERIIALNNELQELLAEQERRKQANAQ